MTGFTQYLLFHYSQVKMILIQIEANIVLNKCLNYLVSASHDLGLFGTIFLFHEWYNSAVQTINRGLSRNRPKGGRNSPQRHTSTRFADHFSQVILKKSLEAFSKNITWCILYETLLNALRQICLKP